MRIFYNKETNQVIFVMGQQAICFYRQNQESIVTIAQQIINADKEYLPFACLCDEIELPVTDELPEKPTTEQPTDTIEQKPKLKKKGKTK